MTALLSFRCKNEFHGLVEVFIFSFPTWSNPSVFIRNSHVMLHESPMSLMKCVLGNGKGRREFLQLPSPLAVFLQHQVVGPE